MTQTYFKVSDMLQLQAKQEGYINEEGVYCYIFNIINTNICLGDNTIQYIIDFENISLDSCAAGKFIWYLNQCFGNDILSNILFTNFSLVQYRQLTTAYFTYNQQAFSDMQKASQNIEQLLKNRPQIKDQFDSLMERWNSIK